MPQKRKIVNEEDIIRDYINNRIGTERLALKYGIGKLRVREILNRNNIQRKNRGKEPLKEVFVVKDWRIEKYPLIEGKHYVVTDEKTGFSSTDIKNKGGVLTTYIEKQYNVQTPTLYDRRMYYMRNGDYWWEQWLTVSIVENNDVKKCPYCDWETIDINNKSGWFEQHLKKVHNITIGEYLKEFPHDSEYFPTYMKREKHISERNERITKPNGYVVCPVCGEKYEKITNWHLAKHGLTTQQFKELYPDCPYQSILQEEISCNLWKKGNLVVSKKRFISRYERELKQFLTEHNIEHDANRQILIGREIDILIPSLKLGIEFDGLKFHTEFFGKKSHHYHLDKTIKCNEKGYGLIHIFEDEYVNHKDIVYHKLSHILGLDKSLPKIPARKCVIQEIKSSMAREFLNLYHIQGESKSSVYLGAFYENKLIAVMTFKNGNLKNPHWELTRFASNYNYVCQGVGGRLFAYFVKEYNPYVVVSFADRRWTVNTRSNFYINLGFELVATTKPDYTYYNERVERFTRYHKMRFNKKTLIKKYGFDNDMTELEMAKALGYDRIWDCGLLKYVYTNPNIKSDK